ncbi:MAG: phosphatase PAP2 family protein [Bacteroidales bacterium]|nr:phosphatase PAP2 family protein [Bacteroidales bacterium]
MEELIFLDKEITLFFNGLNNSFFDSFFYLMTSKIVWIPLYLALLWMIFRKQGGRGLMTVIVVGLVILVADQISSGLMKPFFERLRPSHDDVMQYLVHTVNNYRGGLYGFASSHAANCFALASFFTLVVRRWSIGLTLYAWALINAYGRVYQGVHFVGDILVGALIGILVGRIFYEIYLHLVLHFFVITHHNKWTLKNGLAASFGKLGSRIVAYTFILTVAVLVMSISLFSKYGASC